MADRSADTAGVSNLVIALGLFAALGGAAFLAWRRTAPLSRHVRNRRRDEGSEGGPTPQRNPATRPL
ncbi:hypothetical protein HWV07_08445 [Natronomonas salina]|uniref:hypothetical protein n=1 Tax=Natronomonas salina TaxID=1710540 RepID=UPI0015B4CC09|nr:hypothetical protein [Natronomonas salina]QLD89057.1 hypothetical protein HWV07_08445 [Natronomonas salina]